MREDERLSCQSFARCFLTSLHSHHHHKLDTLHLRSLPYTRSRTQILTFIQKVVVRDKPQNLADSIRVLSVTRLDTGGLFLVLGAFD